MGRSPRTRTNRIGCLLLRGALSFGSEGKPQGKPNLFGAPPCGHLPVQLSHLKMRAIVKLSLPFSAASSPCFQFNHAGVSFRQSRFQVGKLSQGETLHIQESKSHWRQNHTAATNRSVRIQAKAHMKQQHCRSLSFDKFTCADVRGLSG